MIALHIGRVDVALHGISAQLVEQAVEGLDVEIRRRLGGLKTFASALPLDISELSVGPVDMPATLDAGALRDIIADRLAEALLTQFNHTPNEALE